MSSRAEFQEIIDAAEAHAESLEQAHRAGLHTSAEVIGTRWVYVAGCRSCERILKGNG